VTTDGRNAQVVSPNCNALAGHTGVFDCPTIRVYRLVGGKEWKCIFTKKIHYIPIFDFHHDKLKWTGSDLVADK
jgi:hypothetical protein